MLVLMCLHYWTWSVCQPLWAPHMLSHLINKRWLWHRHYPGSKIPFLRSSMFHQMSIAQVVQDSCMPRALSASQDLSSINSAQEGGPFSKPAPATTICFSLSLSHILFWFHAAFKNAAHFVTQATLPQMGSTASMEHPVPLPHVTNPE